MATADPSMADTMPPIRACLFDMDGLLLNTEDLYTICASTVLERHGRPPLPWSIKAKMMGVPGSSNGDVFHDWAKLDIPREQYGREQRTEQEKHFPQCRPLPGVETLMETLRAARSKDGHPMQLALATSSEKYNFDLKTSNPDTKKVMDLFENRHRVLGDDLRIPKGNGKPYPDIYLVALQTINNTLPENVPKILPEECLVFEDSVIGVEAGRRAGAQVVWVPHEQIVEQYKGQESEVLAGRINLVEIGNEAQLGQVGDGWGKQLPSLESFPYAQYGIIVR